MCFDANSYNRLAGRVDLNQMAEFHIGSQRFLSRQPEEKMELQDKFLDAVLAKDYSSICHTMSIKKGEWVKIVQGDQIILDEICGIVESVTSNPPSETSRAKAAKQKPKPKSKSKPKFMESLTGENDKLLKDHKASSNTTNINYFI